VSAGASARSASTPERARDHELKAAAASLQGRHDPAGDPAPRTNSRPAAAPQEKPTAISSSADKPQLSKNQRERIENRIAKIESTVPDLEDRVAKLTTELSSPDAAADFGRVAEISDRIKSTESEIAALYAEWESLADQL